MTFENLEKIETISDSEIVKDSVESLDDNTNETNESYSEIEGSLESLQSKLETTEIVTDLEMVEGIADYLETVEEIKFENWCKLSLEQKKDVLNRIEQHVAAIEHRPALRVDIEEMKPKTMGYQSASRHKIALNSLYVNSNNPNVHREVIDTILHEGRHAYQHYNVDVKCIHESAAEVSTWRENFYDPELKYYQSTGQRIMIRYNDGRLHNVDYRLYYQQPVETDARNFAKDIMIRLEKKGVVASEAVYNQKGEISGTNVEGVHPKEIRNIESADIHESLRPLAPPNVKKSPEAKAFVDFLRKMENNEVGPNDKLLGTTSGYLMWNNKNDRPFSGELLDDKVKVLKDAGTGSLFVQTSTGYTARLENTERWKQEGFFYVYRDIFGNDVAVKTIKPMK